MALLKRTGGLVGELAAEFVGTAILILFGLGVVAQVSAGGIGNHDSIAWAWGLGVTLRIYVASRVSGAHLNPAGTLPPAVVKGLSPGNVPPYPPAQHRRPAGAALDRRWQLRPGPA